jgi:23S rRNA (adenine2503-C2)-methyltransferase
MEFKKINLKGKTLEELREFFEEINEDKYRAIQVFQWLYQKRVDSFDEMTNLSKSLRNRLELIASIEQLTLVNTQTSSSTHTTKFVFECEDGSLIESVLIPDQERLTLCLSTQVGCPLDCQFCATGQMGYKRNLSVFEIIDQFIQASKYSNRPITNIVYMGMGEPFLNYENTLKSLSIFSSDLAFDISAKKITVSTAGIPDKIIDFAHQPFKGKLAFSLHSTDEEIRSLIMPINKKYSLKQNIEALEYFYKQTKRRITFEYILLKGVNDSDKDVQGLVKLSRRIPSKINIIPFNSIAHTNPKGIGATLQPTSQEEFDEFVEKLRRNNLTVFVRNTKGSDIAGACGQLATKILRRSHSKQSI